MSLNSPTGDDVIDHFWIEPNHKSVRGAQPEEPAGSRALADYSLLRLSSRKEADGSTGQYPPRRLPGNPVGEARGLGFIRVS